jgi:hypothetical protein
VQKMLNDIKNAAGDYAESDEETPDADLDQP